MTITSTESLELRAQLAAGVAEVFTDLESGWRDRVIDTDEGFDPLLHAQAVGLGWAGVPVPEEFGGLGLGLAEAMAVIEQLGRVLAPSPLVDALVVGTALGRVGVEPAAQEVLGRLSGEAAVVAVAGLTAHRGEPVTATGIEIGSDGIVSGSARCVAFAGSADLLVAVGADQVAVVDAAAEGVAVTAQSGLDHTRRLGEVIFTRAHGRILGGPDLADELRMIALLSSAVECAAAARSCLETTVEHLKTREQFGRALGTFQALRHRAADLYLTAAEARATADYAVGVASGEVTPRAGQEALGDELAVLAPLAKVVCTDALMTVAADCLQLHGGSGFTFEYPIHHYLKRGKAEQHRLGTNSAWRAYFGQRLGLNTR
ncbi:alkylation response protein AidB-like acyl-CoA dehydrogenase [Branchiibius hedensis]|uniref:Acyl-CoA dehydrogenase n=1 Tax=Branchiibius hedensis TaxID=672460 RepID=A0A2Y9A105_9MICO|nr:acyl-CoA dehydrogenase family protein [Branchiibius hedensis]PWJ27046.1 alkylation response protein AidB-like acyl-CoA dehydrogenase [Branchiibius hedensis]SSA35857.1 Acyl-CoA dehydrogenase [Branchiibius hedensis]